jgi:hypothetical protein
MEKIRIKSKAAKFLANGRAIASQDQFTYMLRSCEGDMSAYGGFVWSRFGAVECPDWKPSETCGNGLHGLLMGQGDIELTAVNDPEAMWLVCAVWSADVVDLGSKVKAPRAWVAFAGSREAAVKHMQQLGANACAWAVSTAGEYGTATAGYGGTATAGYGGTATAGDYGTATAGDYGTATAGDYGTATAGHNGTATAGHNGTATAGEYGTATAGEYGTATAGYGGTLVLKWYEGNRNRLVIGYVGENGIEPNVAYTVGPNGVLVKK